MQTCLHLLRSGRASLPTLPQLRGSGCLCAVVSARIHQCNHHDDQNPSGNAQISKTIAKSNSYAKLKLVRAVRLSERRSRRSPSQVHARSLENSLRLHASPEADNEGIIRNDPVASYSREHKRKRVVKCRSSGRERQAQGAGPDGLALCRAPEDYDRTARTKIRVRASRKNARDVFHRWLSMDSIADREDFWLAQRKSSHAQFLHTTLLELFHQAKHPETIDHEFERTFRQVSLVRLQDKGLDLPYLNNMLWIISASNADEMTKRLLSTTSGKTAFLFLEIIDLPTWDIQTLKMFLTYAWKLVLGTPHSARQLPTNPEPDSDEFLWEIAVRNTHPQDQYNFLENNLTTMLERLLRHCRRLWPIGLISVAKMISPVMQIIVNTRSADPMNLTGDLHRLLSTLLNRFIVLLSSPASTEPLKSMQHSWEAQKSLLSLSEQFHPPLLLNADAYQAVTRVLAACKKTGDESRTTLLRTRSWPPWRVYQDGMDAQRSKEDDFSRITTVIMRKAEAGYEDDSQDRVFKILGGQEPDGTPTIQSRRLSIIENPTTGEGLGTEADEWAARIQATRDVQEAWSAFTKFQESGGQPTIAMYFAMFQKLQYDNARLVRSSQYLATPGAGLETIPPSNDNFSSFYRLQLQPPTVDELYDDMLRNCKERANGRFLSFLISHARTVDQAIQYMKDAQMDPEVLALLLGVKHQSPDVKFRLANRHLAAFIHLLCRLAPRFKRAKTEALPSSKDALDAGSKTEQSSILESRKHPFKRQWNSVLHANSLLRLLRPNSRPCWYELFRGLAHKGTIVDRSITSEPENDVLSWDLVTTALNEFHQSGLALDAEGFHILCNGLEKAVRASLVLGDGQTTFKKNSPHLVNVFHAFDRLSKATEMESEFHIPRLSHSFHPAHLHAYVRILGLVDDNERMINLLEWMVTYHEELNAIADLSHNGRRLMRRVFISTRFYLGGTPHENLAEELINSVDAWSGWPGDEEVHEYARDGVQENVPSIGHASSQRAGLYDKAGSYSI